MKNKPTVIYYKDLKEIDSKPISELIEQLRSDTSNIRGKISDIKRVYGFDDRLNYLEGGLSCMLVSMYHTMEMFQDLEEKHGKEKIKN